MIPKQSNGLVGKVKAILQCLPHGIDHTSLGFVGKASEPMLVVLLENAPKNLKNLGQRG
jgi:hypothetical protein